MATAKPEALNAKALHGLAGDVVRTLEPHTEAHPAALLVQFLVFFGNVMGRGPHFRVGGTRHYTNLFCCLVGRTAGGRKGQSFGEIKAVFEEVEPDWLKDCVKTGLSTGEGLIHAVLDGQESGFDRAVGVAVAVAEPCGYLVGQAVQQHLDVEALRHNPAGAGTTSVFWVALVE